MHTEEKNRHPEQEQRVGTLPGFWGKIRKKKKNIGWCRPRRIGGKKGREGVRKMKEYDSTGDGTINR